MQKQIFGILAGLAVTAACADNYTLIPYSPEMTATGSSQYESARGFVHAIDGSGLSTNSAGTVVHTTSYSGTMWMCSSAPTAANPVFYCVDLGASYRLGSIKIWNYNQSGCVTRSMKATEIYVTDDAAAAHASAADIRGWGESARVASTVLTQATNTNSDPGCDPIAFASRSARYVGFVFTSNYGNQFSGLSEVQFLALPEGSPEIVTASVTPAAGADAFTASVTLGDTAGAVKALAYSSPAADPVVTSLGDVAAEGSASAALSGLAADTTYSVALAAETETASFTNAARTVIYTGAPTLTLVSNGKEAGCVPVKLRVARASADPYPLEVHYSAVSSDGFAGTDYFAPTGVVTIPAKSASADFEIVPMLNPDKQTDTTFTVSLLEGSYYATCSQPIVACIENAVVPEDANYWIAGSSSDGLASTADNWSKGVPRASAPDSLAVCIDGDYSMKPMTWNADGTTELAATVASWTQTATYTGTVTVVTTFADYAKVFTNLTVTGDVVINGGKLAPMKHGTSIATMYRLMMTVGGNFSVGAQGTVSATGLGRYINHDGWRGQASHGGECVGGKAATTTVNANYPAYGSILEPTAVAYGSDSGTDADSKKSNGGGAIYLKVAGDFTNAGTVASDGGTQYAAAGAAGSIYIAAANIRGAGKYSAQPQKQGKTDGSGANGAGGRIALVSSGVNEATNITCDGAREGWGSYGAPGTVYLKSKTLANILVKGSGQTETQLNRASTPIPAASDTMNWKTCAKNIDLIGSTCAHLRLTQERIRVKSLSLLSAASNGKSGSNVIYQQSDLDLAGKMIEVKSVIIDGVDLKLPNGEYRLSDATARGWDWLKDSSEDGTGVLLVRKDGFAISIR